MTVREIWQRITATRYTRALEASARIECVLREEIARLRTENRALLNSILGIAGVPPLPAIAAPAVVAPSVVDPAPPRNSAQSVGAIVAESAAPRPQATSKRGGNVAVPMRRRSWQQINRILEFESAKKKEASDPA
jgi:hypothetical protein